MLGRRRSSSHDVRCSSVGEASRFPSEGNGIRAKSAEVGGRSTCVGAEGVRAEFGVQGSQRSTTPSDRGVHSYTQYELIRWCETQYKATGQVLDFHLLARSDELDDLPLPASTLTVQRARPGAINRRNSFSYCPSLSALSFNSSVLHLVNPVVDLWLLPPRFGLAESPRTRSSVRPLALPEHSTQDLVSWSTLATKQQLTMTRSPPAYFPRRSPLTQEQTARTQVGLRSGTSSERGVVPLSKQRRSL